MVAGCTCTIVQGSGICLIIDPLGAWEKDDLIKRLRNINLSCDDITHVVCTHGHSDHVGNLNLFPKAQHIVGWSINTGDMYILHPFDQGICYTLSEGLEVLPTPGHTTSDVSVLVRSTNNGVVVIAGDLFERQEDIEDPTLWRDVAGSENPELQILNRKKIMDLADYIIPGHGPMFKITDSLKACHESLLQCS